MKTSLVATVTIAFAATHSAVFASDQVASTYGTLFLGASQNLAESSLCLNGRSTCHGLRKLEEDQLRDLEQGSQSGSIIPVNETNGTPEFVCFGSTMPWRCYNLRRLEEDEHRRLELTGDNEINDVECFGREWGLLCND